MHVMFSFDWDAGIMSMGLPALSVIYRLQYCPDHQLPYHTVCLAISGSLCRVWTPNALNGSPFVSCGAAETSRHLTWPCLEPDLAVTLPRRCFSQTSSGGCDGTRVAISDRLCRQPAADKTSELNTCHQATVYWTKKRTIWLTWLAITHISYRCVQLTNVNCNAFAMQLSTVNINRWKISDSQLWVYADRDFSYLDRGSRRTGPGSVVPTLRSKAGFQCTVVQPWLTKGVSSLQNAQCHRHGHNGHCGSTMSIKPFQTELGVYFDTPQVRRVS